MTIEKRFGANGQRSVQKHVGSGRLPGTSSSDGIRTVSSSMAKLLRRIVLLPAQFEMPDSGTSQVGGHKRATFRQHAVALTICSARQYEKKHAGRVSGKSQTCKRASERLREFDNGSVRCGKRQVCVQPSSRQSKPSLQSNLASQRSKIATITQGRSVATCLKKKQRRPLPSTHRLRNAGNGKSTFTATFPKPILVQMFDPLGKERPTSTPSPRSTSTEEPTTAWQHHPRHQRS